jgi:hypothetical protein
VYTNKPHIFKTCLLWLPCCRLQSCTPQSIITVCALSLLKVFSEYFWGSDKQNAFYCCKERELHENIDFSMGPKKEVGTFFSGVPNRNYKWNLATITTSYLYPDENSWFETCTLGKHPSCAKKNNKSIKSNREKIKAVLLWFPQPPKRKWPHNSVIF